MLGRFVQRGPQRDFGNMQKPLAVIMELIQCCLGLAPEDRKLCMILDVGCGSGSATCAALLCGFNVVALDTSQTAVATTASRVSRDHTTLWMDVYTEILKVGRQRLAVEKAMVAATPTPAAVSDPSTTLAIAHHLTETPVAAMTAAGSNAENPTAAAQPTPPSPRTQGTFQM